MMPSSKLSSLCEKIIQVSWLTALVVTPLFFNLDSRRGFEADKLVLLRSIATVMAAAWIVLQIETRQFLRRPTVKSWRSALVLPTLIFVAAYLLSTLLSIAPRVSLLGSYTRMQGVYTTLAYIVIFALIAQTLRTRAQLDRLIVTAILTSVPVALYALIQSAGMDPVFGETFAGNRATGTFGNPVYLAAYLGMIFFVTLAKFFQTWRQQPKPWILFLVYGGIAILQGAALFQTSSRGPFLGWLAGLGVFAILFALITRRVNLARGLIGVGVLGVVAVLLATVPNTPLSNLRGASGLGRLLDLSSNPGDSADARMLTWEGVANLMSPHAPIQFADGTPDALNAIRPLIGYGPETLYLVYAPYIPLALIQQTGYGGDTLIGRSHNETWDALVNGGILGLLANQILFCGFLLVGLRALKLINTNQERNWFIGLWAGLGLAAGALALLLAPKYLGLAIAVGALLALVLYLAQCAWRPTSSAPSANTLDHILLAALVAGIVAHYAEVQFGFGVAATNLLLWVFVGVITAVGYHTLAEETPQTWLGAIAGSGALLGIVLVTLANELVINPNQALSGVTILMNTFAFDARRGASSLVILGLDLVTWMIALILVFAEAGFQPISKSRRELFFGGVLLSLIAFGSASAFAVGRANQLGALALPTLLKVQDIVSYIVTRVSLFDGYVLVTLLLSALAIVMWLIAGTLPSAWFANRWSLIAVAPIVIVAGLWCDSVNLNAVRADTAYNYAQNLNLEYAIALDQWAIERAPLEDVYYRGYGAALAGHAALADAKLAGRLDARVAFDVVSQFTVSQLLTLNQNDLYLAARAVLLRGRELNPLNPDLTVALAQMDRQWATVAPSEARQALVDQAALDYAQALVQRPRDAKLWNEAAGFDLESKQDANAALKKLNQAATIDPRIAQTFWSLGQAYAMQRDSAKAIQAYQHYIALAPQAANVWDAHKQIAALYEQTGDYAAALRQAQLAATLAPADQRAALLDQVARLRQRSP